MYFECWSVLLNRTTGTGGVFIVLEFMERGSLDNLIWDNDGSLKWDTRLQLMEDVAEGMAYLHGVHRSIHRDLKSPNVLLGEEGNGILRAKVADFGLARILGDKSSKEKSEEGETKTVSGFISKRLMRKRKSSENGKEDEDEQLISSSMTCGAGTSCSSMEFEIFSL